MLLPSKINKFKEIQILSLLISTVFSIFYFFHDILNSHAFHQLQIGNTHAFGDDRDGWLQFAQVFATHGDLNNLKWQINFWPPGNIGILTLFRLLSGNLFFTAILHVLLLAALQSLVTYKISGFFIRYKNSKVFILTGTILYHSSFIYRSSFIDTVLQPDYLAAISLIGSLCYLYEYLNESFKTIHPKLFISAVLMAISGYTRISAYQIALFSFAILTIIFITKPNFRLEPLKKIFIALMISIVLFLPWICFRTYGIYDGDISKGIQFSMQGRFALQHQWDTKDELAEVPSLGAIGLGVACEVDPIKCRKLNNLRQEMRAGKNTLNMDQEFDIRSKEAILTFIKNPVRWLEIKISKLPSSYFQKSFYDLPESKPFYSWDLILVLLIYVFYWIFIWKIPKSFTKIFSILLQIWSTLFILQLLLTQTLLRFYIPSILLTLLASLLALRAYLDDKIKIN